MKYILVLLFTICCCRALAQQKNIISGKVVVAGTNTAISNASVFISGTSRGTISNKDGQFTINGIPQGSFELIVSFIGYSTVVHPFTSAQLPLQLTIELTEKATELQAVTVEPFDEETWDKWGKTFLENFIGTSAAARQTTIKNTDKIRFRYYRKKRTLVAIADEPLVIENRALGYTIQYQLEDFIYNMQESSLAYLGYTLFDDMAGDRKKIPRKWRINRASAYTGSMMHFMKSLYNNNLQEEKFEVHRLVKERNVEKDRVRAIYKIINRGSVNSGGITVMRYGQQVSKDSMQYYQKVMRQPDWTDRISPHILTADSLVSTGTNNGKTLYFPNYLHIIYKGGKEEKEYLLHTMQNRSPYYPTSSILSIYGNPVTIDANGLYFPPQEIYSMGYWAWSEKIAHLLPYDFELEEE